MNKPNKKIKKLLNQPNNKNLSGGKNIVQLSKMGLYHGFLNKSRLFKVKSKK